MCACEFRNLFAGCTWGQRFSSEAWAHKESLLAMLLMEMSVSGG